LNLGVSRNRFCDFLADPDSRSFSRFGAIIMQFAVSLHFLMLKMIILPRQARDKHTQVGKTQKEMRFSQGVICTLYGPDGGVVGSETATHSSLPPQTPTTIKVAAIHVVKPRLWSIRTPVLYTLVTVVSAAGQQHNDTINTTLGFRDLQVRRTQNAFLGMRGCIIAFLCTKTRSFAKTGSGQTPGRKCNGNSKHI
jgi:hypothetical protein